ncbi:hypothetical protein Plhal304r1_c078g0164871 [Plasmopara halstedii]
MFSQYLCTPACPSQRKETAVLRSKIYRSRIDSSSMVVCDLMDKLKPPYRGSGIDTVSSCFFSTESTQAARPCSKAYRSPRRMWPASCQGYCPARLRNCLVKSQHARSRS